MADNKDISFKSTQRQNRILPDDSFGDWKWREGLAESVSYTHLRAHET